MALREQGLPISELISFAKAIDLQSDEMLIFFNDTDLILNF